VIGRQDSDRWLAAAELMIEAADEERFEEPILHIHYLNLVSDPLETVETLYRHFGRPLDPHTATRITRLVEAKPNGGYGTRRSHLEEYGLDPVVEHERYARYAERFGIRPERRTGSARSVKSGAALLSGRSTEAAGKVCSTRCAT